MSIVTNLTYLTLPQIATTHHMIVLVFGLAMLRKSGDNYAAQSTWPVLWLRAGGWKWGLLVILMVGCWVDGLLGWVALLFVIEFDMFGFLLLFEDVLIPGSKMSNLMMNFLLKWHCHCVVWLVHWKLDWLLHGSNFVCTYIAIKNVCSPLTALAAGV